jgi:hypothetical protein
LIICISVKFNEGNITLLAKNQNLQQSNQQVAKRNVQLNPQQILIINHIGNQLKQCWTIPQPIYDGDNAGDKDVVIRLKLAIDGEIDDINYQQTRIYDLKAYAMLNNALRAIYKCTPIKNLPKEQYEIWQEISLEFHYSK